MGITGNGTMNAPETVQGHAESFVWYLVHDPMIGVWTVNGRLGVSYSSPAADRLLLGEGGGSLRGQKLRDVLPQVACDRVAENVSWVLQSDEPVAIRGLWRGRCLRSTFVPAPSGDADEVVVFTRPDPAAYGFGHDEPGVVDVEFAELGLLDSLTPRELEVLAYFGQGLGIQDTAKQLHRAVTTIKRFREGIARKLNVPDRCRLGHIARDRGLHPSHASLPRLQMRTGMPSPEEN